MRPRRWLVALVAVGAMASLGVGAAADEALPGRPGIHFSAEVPNDLRALASSTWHRLLQALPARSACLRDVTLRGAWRFGTRGAYDPRRHLVMVRIPGTAPNLRATMVHEFAHHVEFACPAQRRFRPRFLSAPGIPAHDPLAGRSHLGADPLGAVRRGAAEAAPLVMPWPDNSG